jgi:DNA topoisomerase-1
VPQEGRSLGVDPVTGHEIVAKEGRYGPYVTEILPEPEEAPAATNGAVANEAAINGAAATGTATKTATKTTAAKRKTGAKAAAKPKPRTGSLFKGMSTETVTLEDALRLLSLPRLVGNDPESGDEITAQNGRYGPYLKKGTDSRSLTDEEQLFSVTLDEALEIYKQPKQRGRRTAAATPPLRELGNDANTKKPMVIKDGRFGPYVTDGETNASLRKGDSVEQLTDERASELLAERRARGPAPKKAPAKRAPARKKAPAK